MSPNNYVDEKFIVDGIIDVVAVAKSNHPWWWPFHKWMYTRDITVDDIIHGDRLWLDTRTCPCGQVETRVRMWAWPKCSFSWRVDLQAMRDQFWNRQLRKHDEKWRKMRAENAALTTKTRQQS